MAAALEAAESAWQRSASRAAAAAGAQQASIIIGMQNRIHYFCFCHVKHSLLAAIVAFG